MNILKAGAKEYWYFIPIALVILFYAYKTMTAPKLRTGPVVNFVPTGPDPGMLNNIANTISMLRVRSVPGTQTSGHINPTP